MRWWACFRTHRWRRRLAKTWALLYSGMNGHVWEVEVLEEQHGGVIDSGGMDVTSSTAMWAKAAKVGLRLKGETRMRGGERGIGSQFYWKSSKWKDFQVVYKSSLKEMTTAI